MGFDNSCNTGLSLGLGSKPQILFNIIPPNNLLFDDDDDHHHHHHQQIKKIRSSVLITSSDQSSFGPSLTLGLSMGVERPPVDAVTTDATKKVVEAAGAESTISLYRQSSSISSVSTFSNSSVKREREFSGGTGDQEVEEETKLSSKALLISNIDDQDQGGARKKLRLTKEQSLALEESFKEHSTLNPKQKHALAKRLNLSPRQVEVWFQNRRARTKLKQNELDCELLKTCCDSLTDENRRLKKEIQELKSIKLAAAAAAPFYMQFPAATVITMCPSCEKIAGVCETTSAKSPFPVGPKPQFFGGFSTCPSAASYHQTYTN